MTGAPIIFTDVKCMVIQHRLLRLIMLCIQYCHLCSKFKQEEKLTNWIFPKVPLSMLEFPFQIHILSTVAQNIIHSFMQCFGYIINSLLNTWSLVQWCWNSRHSVVDTSWYYFCHKLCVSGLLVFINRCIS